MSAPQDSHGDPTITELAPAQDRRGSRRAGHDPVKREQILQAAKRCFIRDGFEAASMNDITAEAGVSKGTLYVYFADKEDLFANICRDARSAAMAFAQHELDAATSVPEALRRYAIAMTTRLTQDDVVKAQRMVLGVAERMPQLATNFFGPEPFSGVVLLKTYLDRRVAAGELVIDDTELAARQFNDLAQSGLFKRRLFCVMPEPPDAETIARMADRAVDMFLAYYGADGVLARRRAEGKSA
jgi:AcrR family transcriptional regulator